MLKRKIEEKMNLWKESKYGLLIDGARQVGKTYIIREFLKSHFEDYVELNMYENKAAVSILTKAVDSKDFMLRLSTLVDRSLVKNSTVIFIDEVQEFKDFDIVTMMKFLVEKGEYRFVLSGSLLGVEEYGIESWPEGYMMLEKMYPLDFEEFLWANGVGEDVIEVVKECRKSLSPVPDFIHDRFMDLFKKYLLVGGMPKAVETFVEKNDLNAVALDHRVINQFIVRDITKYAGEENRILISEMYDLLPSELNCQSKRFTLKDIPTKYKKENLGLSFGWFTKAGVAIPVYNVDAPEIPLEAASNHQLVKLFHEDVGMLTYLMMNPDIKRSILDDGMDLNFGAIYENAVAQMLTAKGLDPLYYYSKNGIGELDFIIEKGSEIIPIEVKSGKSYKRHSALNNFITNSIYGIKKAYVLTNSNTEIKGIVNYIPIYMCGFL